MNADHELMRSLANRVNRDFALAQDLVEMDAVLEIDLDCQARFGATAWRFARCRARQDFRRPGLNAGVSRGEG